MKEKRILILGATGSMGQYLVPLLLESGYLVDAVSMDEVASHHPNLNCYTFNCFDDQAMEAQLQTHYDGMVDFMMYDAKTIARRLPLYLDRTDHYIFLSSYRVYGNKQIPVTESAPQLSQAVQDEAFLATSNYALHKCQCEEVLQNSPKKNWTIVRPVIVFSASRFPLINLETATVFNRAKEGKPVLFPAQAKQIHAAMMWGGDTARMLAGLLCNDRAKGECVTLATGESVTWEEYVSYFTEYLGVQPLWIDKEEHLSLMAEDPETRLLHRWGLEYDRLFDRVIDISKLLELTGIDPSTFKTVKEALKHELDRIPQDKTWEEFGIHLGVSDRMDRYLEAKGGTV